MFSLQTGFGSILSTAEPTYLKLWALDDGAEGEIQQIGTEELCGGGPGLGIVCAGEGCVWMEAELEEVNKVCPCFCYDSKTNKKKAYFQK